MSYDPKKSPLGGKPVLPMPSGGAMRRAQSQFSDQLGHVAAESEPQPVAIAAPAPEHPAPRPVHSLRKYGRARAFIASKTSEDASSEETSAIAPQEPLHSESDEIEGMVRATWGAEESRAPEPWEEEETQSEVFEHASGVESGVDQNNIETGLYPQVHLNANELPDDGSEEETVLERPPAFSPTIRPGVQKPQRSALRGAEGSLPEDGQMVQMPDGGNLFDFEWDDDVIGKIQCSILVHDGEVAATFLASDINARRLLEAETPRLRVQLESKGLRVTKILVRESEED